MDSIVAPIVLYIIIFLFGAVVGSFLNVCILRIPAHESIVTGPSHCPKCGRRLKWYELVPVFSFLALGGKCSGCKGAISAQYPLIEALNGVLWVLCSAVLGFAPHTVLACLLVSALIIVFVIDWRTMEIPLGMSITILILGGLAAALDHENLTAHIVGLFAVSLPLYLVYLITRGRGIGGGDIKLMAGCGLFLGWKLVVLGFFLGCVIGTIVHLCLMAGKKASRTLAFGPYLAVGMVLAMLWGDKLITWYLGLFLG